MMLSRYLQPNCDKGSLVQQIPKGECRFVGYTLFVGLLLRLFASRRVVLIHPDEIFQQLEPAHRLAFGYGAITWEWRVGVRSWVLPGCFAAIMEACHTVCNNPNCYLIAIRVILCIMSLPIIWVSYKWAGNVTDRVGARIAACLTAAWPQLVIYASHSLSEVVATDALLPGTYLILCSRKGSRQQVVGALLCGIAGALRIQLLPLIIVAICFGTINTSWRARLTSAATVVAPIVLFGVVDWVTLGLPFQSYWKYIEVNVMQGVSERYGILPWYWYVMYICAQYGPLLMFTVAGARRHGRVATLCCLEIAVMSVFAHKEDRFLYPIEPYLLLLTAIGIRGVYLADLAGVGPRVTAFLAGLAFCFSLAITPNYRFRGQSADGMTVFLRLSRVPDICGIYIDASIPWFMTGGYTYLHKPIPIVIDEAATSRPDSLAFDIIVSKRALEPTKASVYTETFREGSISVYKRSGHCEIMPTRGINGFLSATGN